jgi:hypothetical protein
VSNRRKLKGSGDKPDWQVAIVDGEPVQVVNAAEITGHLELAQVDEEIAKDARSYVDVAYGWRQQVPLLQKARRRSPTCVTSCESSSQPQRLTGKDRARYSPNLLGSADMTDRGSHNPKHQKSTR